MITKYQGKNNYKSGLSNYKIIKFDLRTIMNNTLPTFSQDKKREKIYQLFIASSNQGKMTVKHLARGGCKLMRKAKVHYHFFADHSLYKNALYLALFYLNLPYEYNNRHYLNRKITPSETMGIIKLFERRITERVPVEYITQEAYYLGKKFYVNKHVLVPRSLMSTQFKDFLNKVQWKNYRVLDLCAGSGCVGVTLALLNPNIKVDLVDISHDALAVARINVKNFGLEERVTCIQSDLFENIQEKYDLIITNPPYVTEIEYQQQPLEIKNEPKIALTAGTDGLAIINKILNQSGKYLNPQGLLIAEVGYSAAIMIKKIYPQLPIKWLKCKGGPEVQSIIYKLAEILVKYTSYLDSILICEAKVLMS